jgi:hypothetical protein
MATGTKIGTAYFEVDADTTKAQRAVKAFGSTAATTAGSSTGALGQISGGVKELDDTVGEAATQTTGKLSRISDSLKGVGSAAVVGLAGVGIAAVGQFAADSVRAFSDLEQSVGGTEAVFGTASDEIDKFAKTSATSVGLAESEFRSATTLIGGQLKRMTGDVGFASEAATELVEIGADVAATYGGTTKEAVDAFAAALRGEADPAERFNLNLKISAINAKAVELGLAESTDAVDDNAKAQALLALVTEQSADAQGQFAREADSVAGKAQIAAASVENMKARAGEALVPFKNLTTQVQLLGAQALGSVASSIQNLIGQITPAQDAINQFEILTGASADTLAAMVTINQEAGVSFADLAVEMALTADEAQPLTQSQKDFLTEIGLTTDEINELDRVLKGEHAEAVGGTTQGAFDGRQAWFDYAAATDDATSSLEEQAEATQAATDALKVHQDEVRAQSDPLFALFKANQDVAEAQAAVTEAVDKFGEGSPEHIEALSNLTESSFDLRDAQAEARVATDLTKEEFIKQGVQAGVAREQVQLLADKLFALEGLRLDPIQLNVEIRELRRSAGSQRGGVQEFAQLGGHFGAGDIITVGEQGRELFIPDVSGRIVPNARAEMMLAGGGHTFNIHLSGGATRQDAELIAATIDAKLRALANGRTVR